MLIVRRIILYLSVYNNDSIIFIIFSNNVEWCRSKKIYSSHTKKMYFLKITALTYTCNFQRAMNINPLPQRGFYMSTMKAFQSPSIQVYFLLKLRIKYTYIIQYCDLNRAMSSLSDYAVIFDGFNSIVKCKNNSTNNKK